MTGLGIGMVLGGVIVAILRGALPPVTCAMMALGAVLAIVGAIREARQGSRR